MSLTFLRIAQAQINPTVGDLQANAKLIVYFLDQAKQVKADLVTFPELAISGCPPEDLLLMPHFLEDTAYILRKLADHCQDINAIVGCPLADNNKVYNCAAVLGQGKILGIYRKFELPNYGIFDEKRYFSSGQTNYFLDLKGVRLMLTISEDIWVENGLIECLFRKNKCQAVVNIAGSPFYTGKLKLRRDILTRFARRNGAYIIYNNLLGGQDELIFDGGCLVLDPAGNLLACAKRFEQDFLVTDLEFPSQISKPMFLTAHILLFLNSTNKFYPKQHVAACAPEFTPVEEVYQALLLGTRDYTYKNGFKKVVIGLSGGIDSSLVATIATEALGADNVIGVTMPSHFTSVDTYTDANQLANNLGIHLINVPIDNIMQVYLNELIKVFELNSYGVEQENLQARIRGNILMALSNRFGWLVIATGNKSEIAVGYCTLYGDMAGGFAMIKDVPKTLIYELSVFVNQKASYELIPKNVITRAPSAELRYHQKDEDSLPPYAVLDPILKAYIEENLAANEIIALGFEAKIVREVIRLVELNEYKRRQSPLGIKITPKAFGRDRRLPITNHYQARH